MKDENKEIKIEVERPLTLLRERLFSWI